MKRNWGKKKIAEIFHGKYCFSQSSWVTDFQQVFIASLEEKNKRNSFALTSSQTIALKTPARWTWWPLPYLEVYRLPRSTITLSSWSLIPLSRLSPSIYTPHRTPTPKSLTNPHPHDWCLALPTSRVSLHTPCHTHCTWPRPRLHAPPCLAYPSSQTEKNREKVHWANSIYDFLLLMRNDAITFMTSVNV